MFDKRTSKKLVNARTACSVNAEILCEVEMKQKNTEQERQHVMVFTYITLN